MWNKTIFQMFVTYKKVIYILKRKEVAANILSDIFDKVYASQFLVAKYMAGYMSHI